MRTDAAACVVAAALLVASFGEAGQGPAPSGSTPPPAEAMGVSLKNIRKRLSQAPARASGSALHYEFRVDVVGKSPPIDYLQNFDLSSNGGVRFGAPTHQELFDMVTPAPFRTYGGVNLLGLRKKK